MAGGTFASYLANNYVNDKGGFEVTQLNASPNGSGQQASQTAPTKELGPIKWQANPYPDWMRKFHSKMGAVLGTGGGALIGGALDGAAAGSILEPGIGTIAGAALGGIAGSYADDALDYVGIPSNVQVTIPDPPQVDPADTSRPGSGLDMRPPLHPSYSGR